jgi:hypothetical protein
MRTEAVKMAIATSTEPSTALYAVMGSGGCLYRTPSHLLRAQMETEERIS